MKKYHFITFLLFISVSVNAQTNGFYRKLDATESVYATRMYLSTDTSYESICIDNKFLAGFFNLNTHSAKMANILTYDENYIRLGFYQYSKLLNKYITYWVTIQKYKNMTLIECEVSSLAKENDKYNSLINSVCYNSILLYEELYNNGSLYEIKKYINYNKFIN